MHAKANDAVVSKGCGSGKCRYTNFAQSDQFWTESGPSVDDPLQNRSGLFSGQEEYLNIK